MKNFLTICFLVYGLLSATVTLAAPIETFKFESAEQEKVFHKLSEELRCLVCQNQNIAESNAELAKDLRLEIYTMLNQGKSEDEIVDFMVQRYGDYVLYRPPFKPLTWLLWLGPLIVFVIGLFFAARFLKAQTSEKPEDSLSDAERERLNSLHAGESSQQESPKGEK